MRLSELIGKCRAKGIKVELVPSSRLHDYAAMNWKAGQDFGVPIAPNTIWLDNKYQANGETLEQTQARNLKHELDETSDMQKGIPYWKAHKDALVSEKNNTVKMPEAEPEITKVHDDGDLTVRHKGTNYVVTTEGKTFKEVSRKFPRITPKMGKLR